MEQKSLEEKLKNGKLNKKALNENQRTEIGTEKL